MSCRAGILPLLTPVHGFMLHATMTIVLLECKQPCLMNHFVKRDSACFMIFYMLKVSFLVSHSDLGNAALSGQLVPQVGQLKNLQYL